MAVELSPGTQIIQSGAPAVYPREVQVRARYQVPDLLRRGPQPGQRVNDYRLIAGPRQQSQFLHHSLIAAPESAPVQMDVYHRLAEFRHSKPSSSCLLYTSPSPRDGLL